MDCDMKEVFRLFITFLKIGTFTFGGGYAMIPAIRREAVDRRGWVGEEEIADYMAISQSLPGAFAVNISILIGKKVKGVAGALAACFAIVFPAYLTILLIIMFLGAVEDNVYVIGALEGIKAASVALILVTTIQLGHGILKTRLSWIVALASFVAIVALSINAAYAIMAGGIIGYFQYRYKRKKEGGAK